MKYLKPLHNGILFQFEENTVRKQNMHERVEFVEKTSWGFEHSNFDVSINKPRWVIVTAVGDECSNEVQPGMRVLVDALKWTIGIPFNGDTYWKTDSDQVLAIDDDYQPTQTQ